MPQIDHVIVLMMENRSFDFMFGYLNHPSPAFPRLTGNEHNQLQLTGQPPRPVYVTDTGSPSLPESPEHSHRGVMHQLYGTPMNGPAPNLPRTCSGFADSYEVVSPGNGNRIMRCLHPDNIPVLGTLAREFGLLTNWFSSVPGETWPNRNFAHTATADGEVNITLRLYHNTTIFELLDRNGQSWGIFRDGTPQVWCYPWTWRGHNHGSTGSIKDLIRRIGVGSGPNGLPAYSWVEPKHFLRNTSSQHPGSNKEKHGGPNVRDFNAGEALIARIYAALYNNMPLFERTLFLITYDEHGGHFDREGPPLGPQYEDGHVAGNGFRFNLLGPRVPAVLVSPLMPAGHIDDDSVYDHSSIVRTVRERFASAESPIPNTRDGATGNFMELQPWLAQARGAGQMPRPEEVQPLGNAESLGAEAETIGDYDDFQRSLVWLSDRIVHSNGAPVGAEALELPGIAPSSSTRISDAEVTSVRAVELVTRNYDQAR